jgi:hypothetical protein
MTMLSSGTHPTTTASYPSATRPRHPRVVTALARGEVRRMLLSPWLPAGLVVSAIVARDWAGPQGWAGERYGTWFLVPAGLVLACALLASSAFHRLRSDAAPSAPAGESERFAAVLLATSVPVALTTAFVVGQAVWIRAGDGLDLGQEPGRTLHAFPTLPELVQPVLLAVLGVATGAALGRRLRHRITAVLVLLVGWFPVLWIYWAFQAPAVAPLAVVQAQPVSVDVGPPDTDPVAFPARWLLEPPGEYQDHWARLVVSEPLAWGHNAWLVGLSALLLATAMPSGKPRRVVAVAGALVAGAALATQYLVHPA